MAGPDDLKAHAASNQDFYALLDVAPAASEADIRRAYRRTALKYHPDKIANPTPADIDKFHLLQIAYDVLSDPTVRQLYDNAREARERKRRERELMDAAKRKMREDLEARERAGAAAAMGAGPHRGMKRSWMTSVGDDDAEEKLQREIDRIAEDGRRRRQEAEERLRREAAEEEKRLREQEEEARRAADRSSHRVDRSREGGTNVPELQRSVKVRWIREGRGLELDTERLLKLFSKFGKVESIFMLKDKRQHVGDSRKKKTVATGVVVFYSIVGAHSAVLDTQKMKKQSREITDDDWSIIESVTWASGDQPGVDKEMNDRSTPPPRPQEATIPTVANDRQPHIPRKTFNFPDVKVGSGVKKPGTAPTFASFSPSAAAENANRTEKNGLGTATSAPSFEELTLMRLKNAQREKERRALEEQLRREDEAGDAAEAEAAAAAEQVRAA